MGGEAYRAFANTKPEIEQPWKEPKPEAGSPNQGFPYYPPLYSQVSP